MKRKAIATFGILLLSVVAIAYLWPHPARSALPSTATGIRTLSAGPSGFTADSWYQLKAKITRDEFSQFVIDMNLAPISDGQIAKFGGHSGADWWDTSSGDADVFLRVHSQSSLERAKYENGYLYYIDSTGY